MTITQYLAGQKAGHRAAITEVRNINESQSQLSAITMIGVRSLVMDGLRMEVEAVAVIDKSRAKLFG